MKLQRKLRLLYLSEFLVFFHLIGGVLIPFYTIWGGLSLTQVMLLQAWFSACVILFEIPTGTLADTIGRKNTILIGIVANVIGALLYGLFQAFWIFLIAETFWGLAMALFSGAKEALVYDTLIDHKKENASKDVFRRFKTSSKVALMIGAPIGGLVAKYFGLNWVMLLMTIPILLSGLAILFVPEPRSHKLPPDQPKQKFLQQIKTGWHFFKTHKVLRILTFDMVTLWSLAFMIVWFHQVVLTDLGVDVQYFGWFVTFSLASQIFVLKIYPWLENLFKSKKNVLNFMGFLPAVGFLLLGLFPSITMVFVALLFCSGFGLTRRVLFSSYANKFISSNQRATVNSFINIGIHLVAFFIKPIFGFIADINITYALLGLGALSLLISIFSRVEEEMLID